MIKKFARPYHLFFGVLDAVALVSAFVLSLREIPFFFSYFTVLSNILITILFLYFGLFDVKKVSKNLEWLSGAATLYMTVTGVVYWTVLVNSHSLSVDPWINLTLHGVMPIATFASWLLFPSNPKLKYRNVGQWVIPPLLFVLYTLIRGPMVNWYPYPFLSPIVSHGYLRVAINVLVILSGTWLVGLFLVWMANHSKVHTGR